MPDFVNVAAVLVQVDAVDDIFLGVEVWHVHVVPQFPRVHDRKAWRGVSKQGSVSRKEGFCLYNQTYIEFYKKYMIFKSRRLW